MPARPVAIITICIIACLSCCLSCSNRQSGSTDDDTPTYTNPILRDCGPVVCITFHEGYYYCLVGSDDCIKMWRTKDLTNITDQEPKILYSSPENAHITTIWDPQLCTIDGKWYVYFSMSPNVSDNRLIHVLENPSSDPWEGEYRLHGPIKTDPGNNMATQCRYFAHRGKNYLVWSGWDDKRTFDETLNIYIAELADPFTIVGERTKISTPEYEWECQWVGYDGNRSAYPIYTNESPQFFTSRDGDKMMIYYSASAMWTPWYCVGQLTADADADPVNPASWKKTPEPVFSQAKGQEPIAPGYICFIPSPDGKEWYFAYMARRTYYDLCANDGRSLYMEPLTFDEAGIPVLGIPATPDVRFPLPSGMATDNQ